MHQFVRRKEGMPSLKKLRTFVKTFLCGSADIFGIAEDSDFRLIHWSETFGM